MHIGQFHNTTFPKAMQAKTLQVVDEVIATCDLIEELLDVRRILTWRPGGFLGHTPIKYGRSLEHHLLFLS